MGAMLELERCKGVLHCRCAPGGMPLVGPLRLWTASDPALVHHREDRP